MIYLQGPLSSVKRTSNIDFYLKIFISIGRKCLCFFLDKNIYFRSGDVYEGQWSGGMRQGLGTIIFKGNYLETTDNYVKP